MQIQVTLTDTNMGKNAAALRAFAELLDGRVTATNDREEPKEETSEHDVSEMRKTRASRKAVATTNDDYDLGETDEKTEDDSEEDTSEAALTLDGDIIPAFQAYAKKHSREKAAKVLAKYKVTSVRELPEKTWNDVLKTLNA